MFVKELFLERVCPNVLCGTQRCDGSDDWVSGCSLYKKFADEVSKMSNIGISEFEIALNDLVDSMIDLTEEK